MSWFFLMLLFSSIFCSFSEGSHHQKQSAVVVGTVYCDTCFQEDFSKTSHFISGASVAVECKDGTSKPGFRQEVKTNKHGEFEVHLPFSVGKHVKKIKGCSVRLIRSSEPYCAVASAATSSSLHLKSRKQGTRIFSAGFFTFKPLEQPLLCNQKPSVENKKTSGFSTDQLLPPPILPPNPFEPPPLLPPNPFQPPPLLPPNPLLPPPAPLIPNPFQPPPAPLIPNPFQPPPAPLIPNPFQPPPAPPAPLFPNPFQPPPAPPAPLFPNPFQPPPAPPAPLFPNPFQPPPAPPAPFFPFPPIPGLTPPPQPPPPPPPPDFPFPFPPFIPPSPGIPPASTSPKESSP